MNPTDSSPNEERRMAKILYDAYIKHTGGKSLATGDQLPPFDKLHEVIKEAWAASGAAALEEFQRMFTRSL